jgi:hypothetical protein
MVQCGRKTILTRPRLGLKYPEKPKRLLWVLEGWEAGRLEGWDA